jgi:hypothetical protein
MGGAWQACRVFCIGILDTGEKDEVWVKLTQWFLDRLERPGR